MKIETWWFVTFFGENCQVPPARGKAVAT